MTKLLMVEDDAILAKMVTCKLAEAVDFEVVHVTTAAEAKKILEDGTHDFFLGLLDLSLPDAPFGEIIDTVAPQLPVVVFTATLDEEVRALVEEKPVIDYVVKQGEKSIKLIVELIQRLWKNRGIKTLVVDDSPTSRTILENILTSHQFQVFTADNGQEAVAILKQHNDISLVITDYVMPVMDGLELLATIRDQMNLERTELAVIGISGQVGDTFSAKFIKYGGNDFLIKPFLMEELICRVNQNIEFLEHIRAITELAERDFLTGLHNRRYFFAVAQRFFSNAKRKNLSITIAMMDIDHFKKVNDEHGHFAGDQVLKAVAQTLLSTCRSSDLIARMGGEEFCVLASNVDHKHITTTMERFRKNVEDLVVTVNCSTIRVTLSIGVTSVLSDTLDDMLNRADALLYQAKTNGRNRIEVEGHD